MLGAESRLKKKARTTRTTEDVAAHRRHLDSPPQPKKQLSQDGSANENESSKDDFEVLVCKDAFFAGNLEFALDADGQVVGKLAQDQPESYNLKGRSDPRIIAYLEGQTFQKGCSQLEEKISFPFRTSSHDLVGFLGPAIVTPPPAWDLRVVKLACLHTELCGSGTIGGGRDGLIGHSMTGEAEKSDSTQCGVRRHTPSCQQTRRPQPSFVTRASASTTSRCVGSSVSMHSPSSSSRQALVC